MNTNSLARWASRFGLVLASPVFAIVHGSVLAAPILILTVYLVSVLVHQARKATELYRAERSVAR